MDFKASFCLRCGPCPGVGSGAVRGRGCARGSEEASPGTGATGRGASHLRPESRCPSALRPHDKNLADRTGVISVLSLQGRSNPNLIICKSEIPPPPKIASFQIIGVRGTLRAHRGGRLSGAASSVSTSGKADTSKVGVPRAAGVMGTGNTDVSDPGSLAHQGRDRGANDSSRNRI